MIEMKPCEINLIHESILLNGKRVAKPLTIVVMPVSNFFLSLRLIHKKKMVFTGNGIKWKKKTQEATCKQAHSSVFQISFPASFLLFYFLLLALRSDKKDNDKSNERLCFFRVVRCVSHVIAYQSFFGCFSVSTQTKKSRNIFDMEKRF